MLSKAKLALNRTLSDSKGVKVGHFFVPGDFMLWQIANRKKAESLLGIFSPGLF